MVTFPVAAGQRMCSPLSSPSLGGVWCCTSSFWPHAVAGMWGGGRRWPSVTPCDSGRHQHGEICVMLHVLAAWTAVCGRLNEVGRALG